MPILPPYPPGLDPLINIINTVRTRLGQYIATLQPVSGKILDIDTDASAQQICNTAWRKLQQKLANQGFSASVDQIVIAGLPKVASLDPSSQAYISWLGCSDGVNIYSLPALPNNMILPLVVWERWNRTNAPFCQKMTPVLDGLPGYGKSTWNGVWEWRGNAIWLPGSLQTMDLQIRYSSFLPDFVDVATTNWFEQPVPMMQSQDALASYICAEVMIGRANDMMASPADRQISGVAAASFLAQAEQAANLMMNRDIRQKQRVNVSRQPRSGRSRSGAWW